MDSDYVIIRLMNDAVDLVSTLCQEPRHVAPREARDTGDESACHVLPCSTIRSEREAGLIATHVRLDHHAAQLLQLRLRFPPQLLTRFRGVAYQEVDLGRSIELRIYTHDGFPSRSINRDFVVVFA